MMPLVSVSDGRLSWGHRWAKSAAVLRFDVWVVVDLIMIVWRFDEWILSLHQPILHAIDHRMR